MRTWRYVVALLIAVASTGCPGEIPPPEEVDLPETFEDHMRPGQWWEGSEEDGFRKFEVDNDGTKWQCDAGCATNPGGPVNGDRVEIWTNVPCPTCFPI